MKTLIKLLKISRSVEDYIFFGRKAASTIGIMKYIYSKKQKWIGKQYGLEIENFSNIGSNLVLGHPYGITINPRAVIGDNCVVFKGVTIGSIRSGKREGTPIIEDRVVISINATVVGGIRIGSDSLIAANSFVDFDVPPHSLVIGNPGNIIHKEYASKDYIVGDQK